jgi:hypothetical protein
VKLVRSLQAVLISCAIPLAGCGGGGGGGSSKLALVIDGDVIAPAAAGATVTVTVGTETFETTADADGKFEAQIEAGAASADELVSILVKLGQDQSFVELLSSAGTLDSLITAAGDDGVLTAEDDVGANVSVLSTAEAVLIEEGEDAGAKAFTFGDGVDPEEALTLAAALRLAVIDRQRFPLPSGATTTLELARSQQVRETFIAGIETDEPDDLEQAKVALVTDPDVVGPADPARVPAEILAAQLRIGGDYPFNRSGLVSGFELDAGGTGRYFSNQPTVSMSWSIDGTKVRVSFDEPVVATSFEMVDCDGSGTITQRASQVVTEGIDIVLLAPRAVSLTSSETITTPNCPAVQPRTEVRTVAATVLTDANLQSFAAGDVSGKTFAIPVLVEAAGAFTQLPADLLSFAADGGGSGQFSAGGFSWNAADGAIAVSYGDGISGTYRPVQGFDAASRAVLVDFSSPSGRYADLDLALLRDPAVGFVASEIPARYFQYGVGVENGRDERLEGFRLRFDAGGSGAQEDDFVNANDEVVVSEDPYAFRWALQNGELVLRRYAEAETFAPDCDPQTQACVLFDERILVPVNRIGERFYWLERRRIDNSGVDASDPQGFLSRFYDRVPL